MLISRLLRLCQSETRRDLAAATSRGTAHRSLFAARTEVVAEEPGTLSASAALWLARAVGSKGFHLYTSRRWPTLPPAVTPDDRRAPAPRVVN